MDACEPAEEMVSIPCGTFSLEAILAYPAAVNPGRAVLLFNPHPHLGGNMKNNVIRHLARRAAQEGALSLRFDYRGVGNSGFPDDVTAAVHSYYAGIEEDGSYERMLPDCSAAADWLARAARNRPVIYAGYSLGALLAGMLAAANAPSGLAAIAPPNRRVPMNIFEACPCRKVFIAGDSDFVFDPEQFREEFSRFPEPKTCHLLAGCGHFFRQQEEQVFQCLRSSLLLDSEENV